MHLAALNKKKRIMENEYLKVNKFSMALSFFRLRVNKCLLADAVQHTIASMLYDDLKIPKCNVLLLLLLF